MNGLLARRRIISGCSADRRLKNGPGRVKGFESNQVLNPEAKKTHPGRIHSIEARVRQQPTESGKILPEELDLSADHENTMENSCKKSNMLPCGNHTTRRAYINIRNSEKYAYLRASNIHVYQFAG
jgi:hypothetical protein